MSISKIIDVQECCPPVLEGELDAPEAEALASMLKVVADPARLRLLSIIGAQPGGEACVCNLVEPVGLSQPTVSHHLKVLHEAGFLEREKRGQWAYYRIVPEALATASQALAVPGRRRPR